MTLQVSDLRAMLITAGFGTRLAPLTDRLPKPAVPVANRPATWFALDHLHRLGIRDVVLNTHHLALQLEQAVRAVVPSDLSLSFVNEPEILGTGGGVRNAWKSLPPRADETFLAMNGKYVFAPDIAKALTLHLESRAIATMVVRAVPASDPAAVVSTDAAGFVHGLPGYAADASSALTRCMYTGVSLFSARALRDLPERGCMIRDGYARWLANGERVAAYFDQGSFRDVGMSLWHYLEANLELAQGRVPWPGIAATPGPGREGVIWDESAHAASDVSLRDCVVGARVQIASGVQLERCVVWPDTHVSSSHTDAILLPDGTVVAVTPHTTALRHS